MPTLRDISYDPILSNVAIAYSNEDYIAETLFPTFPIAKQHGKYYEYNKAKWRQVKTLRAAGSPANEVETFNVERKDFFCDDHALKSFVPEEIEAQADSPIAPQTDETEGITELLLVDKERALATIMGDNTILTNSSTPGTLWDAASGSDPIGDVRTAKSKIHAKLFREPNTLVLQKQVYDKLIDHKDIIDRIKYSALGVATTELLARLFGVDRVIIAGAGYNSSKEGQDDSMGYIWGKHAWLAYIAPTLKIKQITFGYHFNYAKRITEKWTDGDRKGTFIRVHETYDQKLVCKDACYFLKDVIS